MNPTGAWSAGSRASGGVYAYSAGYDNGTAIAGSGTYYFSGNVGSPDANAAGEVSQIVDLSTGDTATAIAAGNGTFELGAYFSNYLAQNDFGTIEVEFFDAGDVSLGSFSVSDGNTADTDGWSGFESVSGAIDSSATSALVSVYSTVGAGSGGSADGYIDLASFTVSEVPEPGSLALLGLGGLLIARRRRG